MDTPAVPKITVLGKEHAVVLPNFAAREELAHARSKSARRKGSAAFRVIGAALGLCTRLGRDEYANTSLVECDYDLHDYGGRVYSYLMTHGGDQDEIFAMGVKVLDLVEANMFPRAIEVEEARKN